MTLYHEIITELPAGSAGLVNYDAYKAIHPTLPNDREIAAAKPDARVLELSEGEAVLIDYSKFDVIRLPS